jgi:hypothetical protein
MKLHALLITSGLLVAITGEETKTPATDTDAANDHANAGPNGRASSAPGHNKQ